MTRKIFIGVFALGVLVLLLCGLVFFGLQYRQTIDENYESLEAEAGYVMAGLETAGETYLRGLRGGDGTRVTWLTSGGDVLFDGEVPGADDNPAEDPEIRDALTEGEGRDIRGTGPDGGSVMHYAVRGPRGDVLRLSRPVQLFEYAFSSVSPVLWVLLLVLLISSLAAFIVTRSIVQPINSLDLDNPDPAKAFPELQPLVRRIHEQQATIRGETESRENLRKEFSANVSHELKTPLTSISGFAELMRDGMVPPETIPEFSGDIYRESQRLIALVDDIMRLSHLDEAEGFPEPERVELDALAREVIRSLEPTAARLGITIRQAGTGAATLGVRHVLHEMLFNLVDNAIKYNKEHGSVTVETGTRDGHAYFAVSDTGIGIPEDQQERVFERFYRVDKSHSKLIGGTGLGLSIVKHGAAYHHAALKLESTPGTGTRVTVTFSK